MFNVLDSVIFTLLNEYARNPFLDKVLPFFSLSCPLWLGGIFFFSFFIFHCRKHYGDALWRLLVLGIVLGISVGVSDVGASLLKDAFGRYHPYQTLSGTIYYNTNDNAWERIQILSAAESDALDSAVALEVIDNVKMDSDLKDALPLSPITLPLIALPGDAELSSSLEPSGSVERNAAVGEFISDEMLLDADNAFDSSIENEVRGVQNTLPLEDTSVELADVPDSYKVTGYSQAQLQTMFGSEIFSMPSSFAANAMAMAIVIALLFHRTSPWIYMMPIIVGWARVYTGNSYPMDILVGWIWGILAVAIAWLVCDVMFRFVSKNRKL